MPFFNLKSTKKEVPSTLRESGKSQETKVQDGSESHKGKLNVLFSHNKVSKSSMKPQPLFPSFYSDEFSVL